MQHEKTICLLLLLTLCACAQPEKTGNIETLPHPVSETTELYTDAWTTDSVAELWEISDLVVVGRYLDVAPRSYNISRNLSDPSKPSFDHYYENLVYQFEVAEVLKGTEKAKKIEVGQFHGMLMGGEISPAGSFVQPDTESWKLLFLVSDEYLDHYGFAQMEWWLSTAPTESSDWTQLTFAMESNRHDPKDPDWLTKVAESKVAKDLPVSASRSAQQVGYTGAELRDAAKTLNKR